MVNARRVQLENGSNGRSDDSTKSYLPNVTHIKRTEMHLASSTGEPVGWRHHPPGPYSWPVVTMTSKQFKTICRGMTVTESGWYFHKAQGTRAYRCTS